MDCTRNGFCKTLPPETRAKLCAGCRRRFFKAQSMQMRDDADQSVMLVLDGVFTTNTDLGRGLMDHENELPMLYLGLPGRLLNLGGAFEYHEMDPAVRYIDYHYLADTWVATFDHGLIRQLCDEDEAFRHAVYRNMLALIADLCQTSALFRSNYLYFGLYHLVKIFADCGQYISQQQLANLLNCDRTSVSKAFARLKKEHPEVHVAYMANKGRVPTKPYPSTLE